MRLAALASLSLILPPLASTYPCLSHRVNVPVHRTTTYRIFATFDDPGDKVIARRSSSKPPPAFPTAEFSST